MPPFSSQSILLLDLHTHSPYIKSNKKNFNFEEISKWALHKGLDIIGTGDFFFPKWEREIAENLEPSEDGIWKLKNISSDSFKKFPKKIEELRFILSAEIALHYKIKNKPKRSHHLTIVPDLNTAKKLKEKLKKYGDIDSKPRPVIKISPQQLIEISNETSEQIYIIPAHIVEPLNSILSPKWGHQSIEEFLPESKEKIIALETGTSSSPSMLRRIRQIKEFSLVSFSNSHSPQELGTNFTAIKKPNEISLKAIIKSIKNPGPFATYQVYPEVSPHYLPGHKTCKKYYIPTEDEQNTTPVCPVCSKKYSNGVVERIFQLTDDKKPEMNSPPREFFFIPLINIISEIIKTKNSKKIKEEFFKLTSSLGTEYEILFILDLEKLKSSDLPLLSEAIARVRNGNVAKYPGYDGKKGKVYIFQPFENIEKNLPLFTEQKNDLTILKEISEKKIKIDSILSNQKVPENKKNAKEKTDKKTDETSIKISEAQEVKEKIKTKKEKPPQEDRKEEPPQKDRDEREIKFKANLPKQNEQLNLFEDKFRYFRRIKALIHNFPSENRKNYYLQSYIEETLDTLGSRFNLKQIEAINHWGSPLLILGGTATGKTKTLLFRIANLLYKKRVKPGEIALISYNTLENPINYKNLHEKFLLNREEEIFCGNFFQFIFDILKDPKLPLPPSIQVILESIVRPSLSYAILCQISSEKNYPFNLEDLRKIYYKIVKAKQELISPEECELNPSKFDHLFVDIYTDYQNFLETKGYLDFEDLMFRFAEVLREYPKFTEAVRRKYRSIHIDDYQQLRESEFQILRLLISEDTDFCAAADPKQTVYTYWGSTNKYVYSFEDDFSFQEKMPKVVTLEESYRSLSHILEASERIISIIQENTPKISPQKFSPKKEIPIIKFQNPYTEAEIIVKTISEIIQIKDGKNITIQSPITKYLLPELRQIEELDIDEITILYTHPSQINIFVQEAERFGIDYVINRRESPLFYPKFQPLMYAMFAATYPHSAEKLFYEIFQIYTREWAYKNKMFLPKKIFGEFDELEHINIKLDLMKFFSFPEENANLLRSLYILTPTFQHLSFENSSELLDKTVKILSNHIPEHLPHRGDIRFLEALALFEPNPNNFLEIIAYDPTTQSYPMLKDSINIAPLDASKKMLESHIIFITGFEGGLFPSLEATNELEQLEEEIRTLYNSMVKSEQHLIFTYSTQRPSIFGNIKLEPSPILGRIKEFLEFFIYKTKPVPTQ